MPEHADLPAVHAKQQNAPILAKAEARRTWALTNMRRHVSMSLCRPS